MKTELTQPEWPRYQKLMLENVSDVIITTTLAFHILSWNTVAETLYGISAEEAIGHKITDLVRIEMKTGSITAAVVDLQTNKIWQEEVALINRRGERLHFLQTVRYAVDDDGAEIGIVVIGRNITDHKNAEEQLRVSEQFYRTLIADSLDVTMLLSATGQVTFITPSVKNLLGYEVEEAIGTDVFGLIHPDDKAWAMKSFDREVEQNPEIKYIIVRVLKKDGSWLWCMLRGNNLLSNPYVNAVAVYLHDDTPRRLATEALRQSERRFRNLIYDMQVGVLLQSADGRIEMTNNAMCRLFNTSEETIVGGKIWELYTDVIHEDGAPFLQSDRPSYKAFKTGQSVKDVVMGIWHQQRQERIWILITADPLLNESGAVQQVVCSFTDITERRALERKILFEKITHQRQITQATIDAQEKERVEVGKELHDNIGQQLTSIKLFLDLAKPTASPETAGMIEMALKGVSAVINEVRAMSRSMVPPIFKDLGFVDSVRDLVETVQRSHAVAIRFTDAGFDEATLPENKKLSLFRIIQEQLTNIVTHAQATAINIALQSNIQSATLQITDNGKGFEPATTGRGLGLTNITNRAELFGGTATINAAPGKGCTLTVTLPQGYVPALFQ